MGSKGGPGEEVRREDYEEPGRPSEVGDFRVQRIIGVRDLGYRVEFCGGLERGPRGVQALRSGR